MLAHRSQRQDSSDTEQRRPRRASAHATIVAYLALFVALGGSAYAAVSLPSNSVGTAQLRNGAVTLTKVSRSARSSLRGAQGPRGLQGIQGAQGIQGIQGAKGATGAAGAAGQPGSIAGATAGGVLAGTYPNPGFTAGAVSSGAIQDGAVGSNALATGAVLPAKIGTIPAAREEFGLSATSVANATMTSLVFAGTTYGFDNDNVTPDTTAAVQAPIAGIYQIDGGVEWSDSSDKSGYRFLAISVNGGCCLAASTVNPTSGFDTMQNVSDLVNLNAGDTVTLNAEQNSGSTLSIAGTGASFIAAHWVGP